MALPKCQKYFAKLFPMIEVKIKYCTEFVIASNVPDIFEGGLWSIRFSFNIHLFHISFKQYFNIPFFIKQKILKYTEK